MSSNQTHILQVYLWCTFTMQPCPTQQWILRELQHMEAVLTTAEPLVPVSRRIVFTRSRSCPHLSCTVSLSTEVCRSSAMVWVLWRTSRSSCSCSSVSASSPRTACSCPSSIWTHFMLFSLSVSQRWSASSRSTAAAGRDRKKGQS